MKNNSSTAYIILAGVIILCVFTIVTINNILPNNIQTNSYYIKVDDDINAKIESLLIKDNKLNIVTSGSASFYCVKSTKSVPDDNNICWKEITNNKAEISVYHNKKYYVWIKDNNGKISSPIAINTY